MKILSVFALTIILNTSPLFAQSYSGDRGSGDGDPRIQMSTVAGETAGSSAGGVIIPLILLAIIAAAAAAN
ncbi:hypothetical protein PEL8287_03327 [Roseovarius litorisediminis]|uniref:Ferrochelatase n=2 Tax=Roseovarius litorisediminis TaxID=1312363 RepID=A0A1Y5TGL0_9RHOB|nr:hypothetical protein PEL8287_03327 [Roseovarius litorisediminis]